MLRSYAESGGNADAVPETYSAQVRRAGSLPNAKLFASLVACIFIASAFVIAVNPFEISSIVQKARATPQYAVERVMPFVFDNCRLDQNRRELARDSATHAATREHDITASRLASPGRVRVAR